MLTDRTLHDMQKKLKHRFCELREEVRLEMLKSGREPYVELANTVHDIEESSMADMLYDLQLADIDKHIEEIREVDDALMRIAKRSYGVCSECGESIEEQRLLSNPAAKRCYRCQVAYEKQASCTKLLPR